MFASNWHTISRSFKYVLATSKPFSGFALSEVHYLRCICTHSVIV